jgi:hypothetical protein
MITKMLIIGFGLAALISYAGNKYNEKTPVQSVAEMPIVSQWNEGYVQVIERELDDSAKPETTAEAPKPQTSPLRMGKLQMAKLQPAKLE